ncbi:MAG: sigma-54-dependent Fis family transcriptional regulator [Algicola sp.]|nr:sigma-54-dependent Fis family transcriptional regulator [Algicola sp.]
MILIVDDDRSVTASLSLLLKQNKFKVIQAHDPVAAMVAIEQNEVDLVLQDMNFSRSTTGEEGLALVQSIREHSPTLAVILMTAWGSISLAVEGMRRGAHDFIAKPWDNDHLVRTVNTAIGLSSNGEQPPLTRKALDQAYDFQAIIGESPALLSVLSTIGRVCKTDASVLILGESGTGKELIADAIHYNSRRKHESLVKVNLGGITPSLFESEMFGHVKGAFTDARQDRLGRFSTADGGTLFLDELGELDKSSQAKMLRVLQDQTFQMVGASQNTSVNVRIVSATNKDLEAMVAQESFREDLFYRLNLITIELPPLRKRVNDIPLLAQHHIQKISKLYGLPNASISAVALNWLKQQKWPGNIRQLCQTIERVLLMSGKAQLDYQDFAPNSEKEEQAAGGFDPGKTTLDEMEKMMIEKSLQNFGGNISKVAEALGLSRAALYRRMEKHDINYDAHS